MPLILGRLDPRAVAAGILGVLAAAACATVAPDSGAGGPAGRPGPRIVQVIHRNARLSDGRLSPTAADRLVDAAFSAWSDDELPFDAIASVLPERGALTVSTEASVGPAGEALLGRLALVGDPGLLNIVAYGEAAAVSGSPATEGRSIAIVRPQLRDGRIVEGIPEPVIQASSLVLADLIEPTIEGQAWPADAVLVGRPRAVACAVWLVLGSRAAGRMLAPEEVSRLCGDDPGRFRWIKRAIVD